MLANWVQSLTEVAFKNSNSCISQNSFTNPQQQFSWTHNLINIFTGSPSWNTLHIMANLHILKGPKSNEGVDLLK